MANQYDLIIIGGGVTGLAGAMYAGRLGLKTLVLAGELGGTIILTDIVENYPGFKKLTGQELADKLKEHALEYKIDLVEEKAIDIKKAKNCFKVTSGGKKVYQSATILFATGTKHRKLNIPGEDEFFNKGVHTCALCVLPETSILTNPSSKLIKDINKDKILNHKGKYVKALRKIKKNYRGGIINIQSRYFYNTLSLTPNHLILAAKPKKMHLNYRVACKKLYKEKWMKHLKDVIEYKHEWIPASELNKGDYLLYPLLKETKDVEEIRVSNCIKAKLDTKGNVKNDKETHSSVRFPDKIKIDNKFMRLVGYYIAEGHINRGIHLSFNKNELKYANEVKRLIKEIFKLETYIEYNKGVVIAHVYSKLLGDLFLNLFGKLAPNKHLPSWFLDLPIKKQAQLFKTMWLGDGYSKKKGLHYVTTSKQLVEQLKIILLRMEVMPNIFVKSVKEQNKVPHYIGGRKIIARNDKYELEIKGPWLTRICKLTGINHPYTKQRNRVMHSGWFDEDYAVIPIRKTWKENYNGFVYDLSVKEGNSYTTSIAAVHNCDGPMYKNKILAVIGGSDSAAKEALLLTQYAKKVYIIYRKEKIRPEPINFERVERKIKQGKIEIINNTNLKEIKGDKFVNKIVLDKQYKGSNEFKCDAIFIEIGSIPLSELAIKVGVKVNKKKEVMVNRNSETNVKGFYSAGDVVDTEFKQAITGVAEAVAAVYHAYKYINENELVCPTSDE